MKPLQLISYAGLHAACYESKVRQCYTITYQVPVLINSQYRRNCLCRLKSLSFEFSPMTRRRRQNTPLTTCGLSWMTLWDSCYFPCSIPDVSSPNLSTGSIQWCCWCKLNVYWSGGGLRIRTCMLTPGSNGKQRMGGDCRLEIVLQGEELERLKISFNLGSRIDIYSMARYVFILIVLSIPQSISHPSIFLLLLHILLVLYC
jgi:hypothetical protein